MKVLHILNSNKFSGAENVACQIIDMFRQDKGYKFVYVSPDGDISGVLKKRNISFAPLKQMSVEELRRVFDEQKPDVIHAHDMRAGFFSALACGKIPLVSHIHNNAFDSRKLSVKSIAYLYAGFKAKKIFWVSEGAFDGYCFHSFLRSKSEILTNVIDVSKVRILAQDVQFDEAYDIVFVGRLTYPKNPQRLMDVLKKVIDRVPSAKMAVVGTGELEKQVKEYAKELGVENHVKFYGFINNPYPIVSKAKLMLLVSRWEGLPMCVLESLALGVPVVSTKVEGVENVIVNGKNGFISDDDSVITQHIVDVLSDEKLRKQISKDAFDFSNEHNDGGVYMRKIKDAYGEIVR